MLKDFLSQIYPLDEPEVNAYLSACTEVVIPRKTIVTAAEEVERYLYFVIEGIQKSYYLHSGKQHVIAFTYAPSFSGIPDSFLTQSPSNYFLETITESKFLRISYHQHVRLLEEHRSIETLFRKATEWLLVGMIHRHYELMALDMEHRFRSFLNRSPHLLNMVPHKDLASYLRIDASNFSKLLGSVRA